MGLFGRLKKKARKVGRSARKTARKSLKSSIRSARRVSKASKKAVRTTARRAKRGVRKAGRGVKRGVLAGARTASKAGKGVIRGAKKTVVTVGKATAKLAKKANPLGFISRIGKIVKPLLIVAVVGGGAYFLYPVLKPILMARKGAGKLSGMISKARPTQG